VSWPLSSKPAALSRALLFSPKLVNLKVVDTEKPDQIPNEEEELPAVTLEGQLAAVTSERDQLLAEKADLQDRLRRSLADFDNARKRFEQQRSDFVQFAATDLVRNMLPVLDDFERALKVDATDQTFAKGIKLIYQRFADTLKRMGLEPFDSSGKPFDPNLHQAVERVESQDHEDQTVLAEFQRGYNFKGKLLRPAMVKVAVKP
jgi:molecular chaperone GrpE